MKPSSGMCRARTIRARPASPSTPKVRSATAAQMRGPEQSGRQEPPLDFSVAASSPTALRAVLVAVATG
jgi:hypothetical protein